MIQLMSTLKKSISDKLLSEQGFHIPPETDEYLTKYFSDLQKIKDLGGFIFATKDNTDLVFILHRNKIFMNKNYYDQLPDFVKENISNWILKTFSADFIVQKFGEISPILRYLKYKPKITRFINLKFFDLEIFEYMNEKYFLNSKTKEIIVHLMYREVLIDEDFFNLMKKVFNLSSSVPEMAISNWFDEYYEHKVGFEVVQTGRIPRYFYEKIKKEGEYLGLVKDNLKK